jgi:hypothetical protein
MLNVKDPNCWNTCYTVQNGHVSFIWYSVLCSSTVNSECGKFSYSMDGIVCMKNYCRTMYVCSDLFESIMEEEHRKITKRDIRNEKNLQNKHMCLASGLKLKIFLL